MYVYIRFIVQTVRCKIENLYWILTLGINPWVVFVLEVFHLNIQWFFLNWFFVYEILIWKGKSQRWTCHKPKTSKFSMSSDLLKTINEIRWIWVWLRIEIKLDHFHGTLLWTFFAVELDDKSKMMVFDWVYLEESNENQ